MKAKKYQKTIGIMVILGAVILLISSNGIGGTRAWTNTKAWTKTRTKTLEKTRRYKASTKRSLTNTVPGVPAYTEGAESLVKISPNDTSIEGPVTAYSPEDREITINNSSYRLCQDAAIFYQTPTYLRRVSLINLETAEEAKVFLDPRLSCAKEVIILRAGK